MAPHVDRLAAVADFAGYRRPARLTDHAIEQWCSRWRPSAEVRKAADELRALLPMSLCIDVDDRRAVSTWTVVGDRGQSGAEWFAYLVVSKEGAVITVLPPGVQTKLRTIRVGGAKHSQRKRRS